MTILKITFLLATAVSLTAQDVTTGTVLNHVTVVNTRTGALSPNMAVVIGNGKIVTVASASTVRASGTARVVDATGKFVVPGYNDMHAHVVDDADAPIPPWPMLIANGITGFRQMTGSPELLTRGQHLRQEVNDGKVVAPEPLALVGRILVPVGVTRIEAGITTPAAAVQEIQDQKRAGTDFIKVVNVSREVFFATAEETKRQKLDLVGHLPYPQVSGTEASNAGMKAVEHLGGNGYLFECSTDEATVRQGLIDASRTRQQPAGPPPTPQVAEQIRARFIATPTIGTSPAEAALIQRAVDTYSEDRCRTFAKLLAKNGTWQPLTLIRLKTMDMPDAYQNDPNLKYMPPPVRALWRDVLGDYNRLPAPTRAALRQVYEYDLKMVKIFKQEGVKMVAGDDLGGGGGWIVTGFGLHQEFKEMAAAGLTPLEILQTTTINAAEFLRRTDMGSVESGKSADLVLLDANPVASVENLDKVSAVVLKGRFFDRTALDKMMADVEAAYR